MQTETESPRHVGSSELLGIVIEKGIPVPYKRGTMKKVLAVMEVGDSFKVPNEAQRMAALSAAKYYGHELTSEKLNDGYRVWLTKKNEMRNLQSRPANGANNPPRKQSRRNAGALEVREGHEPRAACSNRPARKGDCGHHRSRQSQDA